MHQGCSGRVARDSFFLKCISAIRKLLYRRFLVFIVGLIFWMIVAGLVWSLMEDIPGWVMGLLSTGLGIVIGTQVLLEALLDRASEKIARNRLKAAEPHYQNADSFRELEQYDLAISEYGMAIGIDPDNVRAYTGRGNIYELKGEHDLAIADFTTAIEMDSYIRGAAHRSTRGRNSGDYDLAWAHYYRGCSYQTQRESELARSDFEAIIAVNHYGFPNSLVYNYLPVAQEARPEDVLAVKFLEPEDASAVHYVRPCQTVRRIEGLKTLCSRYYLAVTCNGCLANKPKKRGVIYSTHSRPGKTLWGLILLVTAIAAFAAFVAFKEGNLGPGLLVAFISPTFLLNTIWDARLGKAAMKIIKPLAAKYLAKQFR